MFNRQSNVERILKICYDLPNLLAKDDGPLFWHTM